MSVTDALALLRSPRASERLRGARLLAREGDPSLAGKATSFRQQETDSWVKSALDRTINAWRETGAAFGEGQAWISVAADQAQEEIRADALRQVTAVLLHEIRPLVGDIEDYAIFDIGDSYGASETSRAINRLRELLSTVQNLHEAAVAAKITELDLTDVVNQAISVCGFSAEQAMGIRDEPVPSTGDAGLLSLALVNVLKNAVEASEETGECVFVNCASTDNDAWICVLDRGSGLPDGHAFASQPGLTTKSKATHFGWGLSIAERAMHSMSGSIKLSPREDGGTSCELRWPLLGADR